MFNDPICICNGRNANWRISLSCSQSSSDLQFVLKQQKIKKKLGKAHSSDDWAEPSFMYFMSQQQRLCQNLKNDEVRLLLQTQFIITECVWIILCFFVSRFFIGLLASLLRGSLFCLFRFFLLLCMSNNNKHRFLPSWWNNNKQTLFWW